MIFADPNDFDVNLAAGTATHLTGPVAIFEDHGVLSAIMNPDLFPGPIESLELAATIAMNRARTRAK